MHVQPIPAFHGGGPKRRCKRRPVAMGGGHTCDPRTGDQRNAVEEEGTIPQAGTEAHEALTRGAGRGLLGTPPRNRRQSGHASRRLNPPQGRPGPGGAGGSGAAARRRRPADRQGRPTPAAHTPAGPCDRTSGPGSGSGSAGAKRTRPGPTCLRAVHGPDPPKNWVIGGVAAALILVATVDDALSPSRTSPARSTRSRHFLLRVEHRCLVLEATRLGSNSARPHGPPVANSGVPHDRDVESRADSHRVFRRPRSQGRA